MADQEQTESSSLAERRLAGEVEKLNAENKRLRQSDWKSPTTIIATAGLVVSLIGNGFQFFAARRNAEIAAQQLALAERRWDKERLKWDEERLKLAAEVDALQAKESRSADRRAQLQSELDQVNGNVSVWDDAIREGILKLQELKVELASREAAGQEHMANATRRKIELQESMNAQYRVDFDSSKTRQTQIERQLGE